MTVIWCCTAKKHLIAAALFLAAFNAAPKESADKDYGHIVDYKDLFKKVENAISVYADADPLRDQSAGVRTIFNNLRAPEDGTSKVAEQPPESPEGVQKRVALAPAIEPMLGAQASRLGVRRMKTKWGSCIPASRSLLLNQELARKPPEFLEYIVVHELMHLLEPTHSPRFIALMDLHMPKRQFYRDELNRLSVGHEEW